MFEKTQKPYLNQIGFDNVDQLYLFNPASSPAQGSEHVKENIDNSKKCN